MSLKRRLNWKGFWKGLKKIGQARILAIAIVAALAANLIGSPVALATSNSVLEAELDSAAAMPVQYGGEATAVAISWDTLPEIEAEPKYVPTGYATDISDVIRTKEAILTNPPPASAEAVVAIDSAEPQPQAPTLLTDFQTIQYTGWIPPDPNVAVGPSHVGVIVNSSVEFYTKTGTAVRTSTLSSWFFNVSPPGYPFDPKILYDHYAGRWLIVALAVSESPQASSFLVSVSQSPDPTGNWWAWNIDAMTGVTPPSLADYPGVGFNDTAVYISANMFSFAGGLFQGTKILGLSSSELYSGSTLSLYYWYGMQDADGSDSFTVQPVHTFGSPSQQYFVNSKSGGGNVVTVWRTPRQFPPTTLYQAATLTTQPYAFPPDAEQMGGTERLDTVDCRIFGAQYRDGYIYTAIASGYDWPPLRATIVYWKIYAEDPTYSLVTDLGWGDPDYDYYFPHVYSDSQGNVNMVFNRSGPTEYAGIRYTNWTTGDSAWQASAQLKAGEAYYVSLDSYGRNRWGDYNGIGADPNSPGRMFICSEYAKAGNQWGTWVGEVTSLPTVSISTDKFTYYPGETMTITIDVSNQTADSLTFNWFLAVPSIGLWNPISTATVPAGFETTVTVPIYVPNWGPIPFALVWYVELQDPVSAEVLASDVAGCVYSPGP